jgi:hypothetical protein
MRANFQWNCCDIQARHFALRLPTISRPPISSTGNARIGPVVEVGKLISGFTRFLRAMISKQRDQSECL